MIDDFFSWVADPVAYNWISLSAALASLLTAAFTGYTAFLAWKDRRQTITAVWTPELHRANDSYKYELHVKIANNTTEDLKSDSIEISGGATGLKQSNTGAKNASWPEHRTHVALNLDAGAVKTARFEFWLDLPKIQRRNLLKSYSPRMLAAKALWHIFYWRVPAGPRLSISLILRRRSSPMRPIRLTHVIRIYPQTIKQIEAIIKDNEEST